MIDFYNKFKEKFNPQIPSQDEFIDLFRTKPIKYVFRDKNNRSLKNSPELFNSNVAKFALVELEGKMRQLDKSELKILQITNKD